MSNMEEVKDIKIEFEVIEADASLADTNFVPTDEDGGIGEPHEVTE